MVVHLRCRRPCALIGHSRDLQSSRRSCLMPVLGCHGTKDANVPICLMRQGVAWLQQAGFKQVTRLDSTHFT